MTAASVLVLTTYPVVEPRHGGQIRAKAVVEAYRSAGFETSHFAVVEKGAFPRKHLGPRDLEFEPNDPRWYYRGEEVPLSADLRSGLFAAHDANYRRILKRLPRRIDVFHLEQPWLLPLVKRLRAEPSYAHAQIVYGSQNIETPLRASIFRQMRITNGDAVLEAIQALEEEAAHLAAVSLAVSPADSDALVKLGARRVVLAANGINAWTAPAAALKAWRARLPLRKIALFVGSAHPPNFDGFIRALGDALGMVPPDCRIVLVGGASDHLVTHYSKTRYSNLDLSRLEPCGQVEADDLSALRDLASVFLLPIFEGGGSNIKTAEALFSGKPVIATSTSLRGYSGFETLPEVTVADTREEFRAAVKKAFAPGPSPTTFPDGGLRRQLLWDACLAQVAPAVRQLLAP